MAGQIQGTPSKLKTGGTLPSGPGTVYGGANGGKLPAGLKSPSGTQPPPTPPIKQTANAQSGGKAGGKKGNAIDQLGPSNNMDKQIQEHVEGILSGSKSRWSDERMQMSKDQVFESTVGQTKAQIRGMNASLAKRGLLRSGLAVRAEKDLRAEGMKAYSKGVRELMMKKMDDEFNDKMKAMDTGINWLNSRRNYELGKERNEIARDQIAASMAAAKLNAQVQREGIAASRANARAALDFQKQVHADQMGLAAMSGAGNYDPYGAHRSQQGF